MVSALELPEGNNRADSPELTAKAKSKLKKKPTENATWPK